MEGILRGCIEMIVVLREYWVCRVSVIPPVFLPSSLSPFLAHLPLSMAFREAIRSWGSDKSREVLFQELVGFFL